jgi:hypothetical protein
VIHILFIFPEDSKIFGYSYYNQTTRRYIAIFGTLFNNISIGRSNNAGSEEQRFKVPVNYGPMQKFLSKIEQDPDLQAQAITLPRISFELTSMNYAGDRKLTNYTMTSQGIPGTNDVVRTQLAATPYDLEFSLNIMAKYSEDATKIVEQILPFFKPEFTVTATMIDTMDTSLDIPIILNSINSEDTYEGSYDERRAIIWTLQFTLKGYYFGPISNKKIIKFIDVNSYTTLTATLPVMDVQVRPGLTANGQPTTILANSIPYANVNIDDDWAHIVTIRDL